MRFWALIFMTLTWGGCQLLSLPARDQPVVDKALIDLQSWSFSEKGNVTLSGDWRFQPGAFLDPATTDFTQVEAFSRVPGSPNPGPLYVKDESVGYGTYALRLLLRNQESGMGLRLWMVQSAFILWIRNNQTGALHELTRAGRIGTQRSEALGEISEHMIAIPDELLRGGDVTLIVQASAFYTSLAIMGVPRLGLYASIFQEEVHKQMERTLVMGGFFLVALYSLALFLGRRKSPLDFWSFALASNFLLRYCATEMFPYWFVKGLAWIEPVTISIGYWSTQLTIVILAVMFTHLHPLPLMRNIRNASLVFNALVIIMVFSLGFDWIVRYAIKACFALLMINGFALFGGMIYLSWKRAKDMDVAIFGLTALTIAGLNDYLVFFHHVPTIFLMQYAILFFAFTQSLITGRRFARTFLRNEELLVEISEKERARTVFFHNTSHELRTPLNGLIGFLQLLSDNRYGAQTPQAREQLLKCIRLAESLKNQVNTILDLAKSKKGSLVLENSMIPLDELFHDTCNLAEGLLLKRVDSRFEAERSFHDEKANFVGDREKIRTIVRNLLGNAFKFADPQRSNYVKLLMQRDEQALILTFTDSGIGIPKDQLEVIFEEFRQVADDARRSYEGTGLGLSMVRDLVELMGGVIDVQSEPGRGSIFRVVIPEQTEVHTQQQVFRAPPVLAAVTLAAPDPAAAAPLRSLDVRSTHAFAPRILVVDDNEINCEVVQHMLEEQGYEVLIAYGGQEALVKMRTEVPDLVLLDMMMPQVSGEDVMKAMKADSILQDIPVILVTARASEDDRIFGLGLGADDYLAKPIHQEELHMRVRNLLHRLELNRRMSQLEERDRFAQLGELLGELSHELKNIFQFSELSQRIDRRMLGQLIERLPVAVRAWPRAAELLAQGDLGESSEAGAEGLSFASLKQSEDPVLRSLRMRLAHLPLQQEDKREIWQSIQNLSEADRIFCDHQLVLVRSFVLLRDQSRYARDLIMDILEFNQNQDDQAGCDLIKTIETVMKLCRPRLARLRIRVELSLVSIPIQISSGAFMQVLLNLLSNACDAMQNLPSGERWIRIQADIQENRVLLRMTNAGAPIPEAVARSLFERGFSSKGRQGSGLGLSIVWRLLQRVHGSIELDKYAKSPSFTLTIRLRRPSEVNRAEVS